MSETHLTISEARTYLAERRRSVSRETIWRWIKAGKLRASRSKTGRTLYVLPSDLDELLKPEEVRVA